MPTYISGDQTGYFEVVWKNLSYTITKNGMDRMIGKALGQEVPKHKTVLREVNGSFRSGQLTALMGPSGAGKSTLMECIVGKRSTGLTGTIECSNATKLEVSFIPQHDQLFGQLTVSEALYLRCNLCSRSQSQKSGKDVVEELLRQLGLEVCATNRINMISGGQQKRLSIALELVSKPSILVLDEPTSGLDSSSCHLVVELLHQLTQSRSHRMAVVCTIHQPSFKVFSLFQKVYMMGKRGKPIYEGAPEDIIEHLAAFGFDCPQFYNPADFIIEVACEEYGQQSALEKLTSAQEQTFEARQAVKFEGGRAASSRELRRLVADGTPVMPFWRHFAYLTVRAVIMTLRDPWLFGMRFSSSIAVAILLGTLFGDVGGPGACPPKPHINFTAEKLQEFREQITIETKTVMDNMGCLFFGILFIIFSGLMPTVLTFPMEMSGFLKEKGNNWYGVTSYFVAKTVAEIPFQFVFTLIFVLISYFWNHQPNSAWRFFVYLSIQILVGFIAQSQGMLVGALLMSNLTAAVYIAPMTAFPMILISGFFIRIESLSDFWVPITYFSYMRFAFEAMIVTFYGYSRCGSADDNEVALGELGFALSKIVFEMIQHNCGAFEEVNEKELFHLNNQTHLVSGNVSGNATEATGRFIDGMLLQMTSDFGGKDIVIRSKAMNMFDLDDRDLWHNMIYLGVYLLVIRTLAFFVVLLKANARE